MCVAGRRRESMTHIRILAVAVVVGAIGFASTQLGAQDNAAREARDRAEIEALMWRYARALDTSNAEAYAAAYTPDGQFSAGTNATKGRRGAHEDDRRPEGAADGRRCQRRGRAADVSHDHEPSTSRSWTRTTRAWRRIGRRCSERGSERAGARGRGRPQHRPAGARQRPVVDPEPRRRAARLTVCDHRSSPW